MKKVLITGVSGFLGKALVSALHQAEGIALLGHTRNVQEVRSLFKDYQIEIVEKVKADLLNQWNVHTVIHLAGIAHDLTNRFVASDYFTVNDQGTRLIYDQFMRSQACKFIFLSSIKAVVDIASSPVKESVVPAPRSPYGQSKLSAEQYIRQQSTGSDKSFYILRPCMVHGPGNKGNLNVLYKYVKTGLPFPLGSFSNQRSFLSIDNFNFIIKKLITENIPSGVYHLADDGSLSTADLVRLISRTAGKRSRVFDIPPSLVKAGFTVLRKTRMLDKLTEDMLVANEKIKEQLGAALPVTMQEGLVKTIKSFDAGK